MLRVLATIAASCLFALSGVWLAAAAPDERFLAGLRARRLFTLAEAHCRELLAAPTLSERDRVELTIELARTYAQHAAHTPTGERVPLWTAAHDALAALRARTPPPPRKVLLDLQAALLDLSRGELARQEAELGAAGEAALNDAREALRAAIRQLEQLDAEVAKLIRDRNRDGATPPGELSTGELLSLQQHVRFELARALRNQAQCYPPDSPDAIGSLSQAVRQLTPLAELAEADPLVWRARVDVLLCQRLLKDFASAAKSAAAIQHANPPPGIRLAALAEQIRLELAQGQPARAQELLAAGRTIEGEVLPELDEAFLETYVALWLAAEKAQDMSLATKWQDVAAQTAITIEQLHGPYWARRAQQALARAAGQSTGAANLDVLERTAANHYRLQQYAAAVTAYDQAAEKANAAGLTDRAFPLAMAAAAIEHKQQHLTAARDRFRTLALKLPKHPEAPTAHWNAIACASLLARESKPPQFDEYLALLAEHLATWPAGPTADKARWWLGVFREERGEWNEAIAAYRAIAPTYADYPAALGRLARCHAERVASLKRANMAIEESLAAAVADLEVVIVGVERRWPEKWSPAQRTAALDLARLRLAYDRANAAAVVAMLEAALRDVDGATPEWTLAARATLVVAMAGAGRGVEAEQIVRQLAAGPPKQLYELALGLSQVSAGPDEAAKSQLAQLQLAAIALLVPKSAELAPAERIAVRRIGAAALATAGKRDEALREYATLAKEQPQDGAVQEAYAEHLSAGTDAPSQQAALAQWRFVIERSRPHSERWYRASLGVARAQLHLGQKAEAKQFLQLLIARPPGLEGSPWKAAFLELLREAGG